MTSDNDMRDFRDKNVEKGSQSRRRCCQFYWNWAGAGIWRFKVLFSAGMFLRTLSFGYTCFTISIATLLQGNKRTSLHINDGGKQMTMIIWSENLF